MSDDLVRANIHVKVGDAYNPNATTEDIRTLKTTGFFYNIQVAAERTDGGVKLIYVVQGQPVISDSWTTSTEPPPPSAVWTTSRRAVTR